VFAFLPVPVVPVVHPRSCEHPHEAAPVRRVESARERAERPRNISGPPVGGTVVARTVYTSGPGGGRSVPAKDNRPGEPAASIARERQRVRVRLERAGRSGKTVTVAGPFALVRTEAALLLAELKRACGGGGALRPVTTPQGTPAFALELQGDHVGRLPELLRERGFRQAR
jgi:translation initiation factor 1